MTGKTKVLLLGAGKIGGAIVEYLAGSGDYLVTVADHDEAALRMMHGAAVGRMVVDVTDREGLAKAAGGMDMVLSALPFYLNVAVAEVARAAKAHYFDLTEDVETTRAVKRIAAGAATAFVPQCGLAPGFISVVAHDLSKQFDSLRTVQMRVGALPQFPTNALKYNLTWSTDGLINEYCNPCEAIHQSERREVLPLEGLEHFSLDGIAYEAFNTSGGLGTLCDTLEGKVEALDYKTVRYPGHRDLVKLLVEDLRLGQRRHILKDVLEASVPMTKQDVVLIFVTVSGMREGRLTQESYAKKIYNGRIGDTEQSAIQITTAAGICAMVDLLRDGKLSSRGFVRQEDAALTNFLANRFGKAYA